MVAREKGNVLCLHPGVYICAPRQGQLTHLQAHDKLNLSRVHAQVTPCSTQYLTLPLHFGQTITLQHHWPPIFVPQPRPLFDDQTH